MLKKIILCILCVLSFSSMFLGVSHAAGVIPETSVVLLEVADGEGVITLKNTDAEPVLLYTSIESLPEDQENIVFVTPPVARVEPGGKQLVRFILQPNSKINKQRLKRVIFEGIPQVDPSKPSKIKMTVRQNLPVLINPKNLPAKTNPWELLRWSIHGKKLTVKNDSPYVVRLNMAIDLQPSLSRLSLTRPYILPGKSEDIALPEFFEEHQMTGVRIYPVSVYGYQVKPYDAVLSN